MRKLSWRLRRFVLLAAAVCIVSGAPAARAQTPLSVGAHFVAHRTPELGETLTGFGFLVNYNVYLPLISLEAEANFFPTSSTGDLGEKQFLVGANLGTHIGKWGAYAKFHPGFTHFSGGAFPNRLSDQTHFAMEVGGVLEYHLVPKIHSLRGDELIPEHPLRQRDAFSGARRSHRRSAGHAKHAASQRRSDVALLNLKCGFMTKAPRWNAQRASGAKAQPENFCTAREPRRIP